MNTALVTGASSGIGFATAQQLLHEGWHIYAVARREDKLKQLDASAGQLHIIPADVTDQSSVDELLATVEATAKIDTLINIAGGALGTDSIAEGNTDDWQWMYETNVLGTLRMLKAFLPMLRAHGAGTVLNLTSTAALAAYEGGGGYNAAKSGQAALTDALRLEEAENNIRVIDVQPGLVKTDEFSTHRFRGDDEKAAAVYAGVSEPLTAEDVADVCVYAVTAPHRVNLDKIVMRPVKQAAQHKLIRDAQ